MAEITAVDTTRCDPGGNAADESSTGAGIPKCFVEGPRRRTRGNHDDRVSRDGMTGLQHE